MKQTIHLRFFHPDGSSKDWFGEADAAGINISWGKTGHLRQGHFLSSEKCYPSPYGELDKRAMKKIRKGYVVLNQRTEESQEPNNNPKQSDHEVSNPAPSKQMAATIHQWTTTDSKDTWF